MPQNLCLAQSEFFLAFYPKYMRLLGSCLRSQLSNKMADRRMIMQNIVRQIKVPRLLQDWTNSLEMFTEEIFSRYRFRWATILFICSLAENALKHPANRGSPLPPLPPASVSSTSVLCHGSILQTADSLAISKSAAGRDVRGVTSLLSSLARQYVRFPSVPEIAEIPTKFYNLASIIIWG